jgi:hypothetical protein
VVFPSRKWSFHAIKTGFSGRHEQPQAASLQLATGLAVPPRILLELLEMTDTTLISAVITLRTCLNLAK